MSNSSHSIPSPPPSGSSDLTPPPPSNLSESSPPPSSNSSRLSPPPPSNSSSSPSPSPPQGSYSESPPPPPFQNGPPSSRNNNPPPSNNNNPPPSNNNNNNSNNNGSSSTPRSSGNSNSPSPPPPSSRSGSSSRKGATQISDSSSNDNSSPNGNAIIIGAAAGAGLLLFIMICFLISCARRKKRKHRDQINYYRDNSTENRNNYYKHGHQGNWNNNVGPHVDHMVKIPPPQGSAQVSSEHNWQIAPPPPPPPMMSSSELSSAVFSGPKGSAQPPPHPAMSLGHNQSSFTYEDLAAATGGFAKSNLLGQGGFGYVHKGVLPNGKEVAVKSLKANSGQGEREFQAEVDIISRVHHRYLVSLVGYCIAGSQRMLVYEFVPNGTLEYHLHVSADRPTMDWPTRLKIALGSAKGFAYLHEDCHPRIIHRDIKAANILLDHNFDAKVADFGLAKLSSDNFTHVSTRIMGTFGYLAPEYASSGKLTEKSDVYSYGIMLLELITGRRPVDISSDDDGLVDWARPILLRVTEGGSYKELVDPRLENNYDPKEMLRMVASVAASIRHSARRRPKMSQIVRALEGDVSLEDLNEGVKAVQSSMFGSSGSSSYGELVKFRKDVGLSSQEFNSSEHGMTGELVAHPSDGSSSEIDSQSGSHTRNPN